MKPILIGGTMFILTTLALVGAAATMGNANNTTLPNEQLGDHFWLHEFTRSAAASRLGVANDPSPAQIANLRILVHDVLDPLRRHLKRPVEISGGFRTAAVNQNVDGSASDSDHMNGLASDIKVPAYKGQRAMTNYEIAALLHTLKLPVDQCIWYEAKGHCHVSTRPGANRHDYRYQPKVGRTLSWMPTSAQRAQSLALLT